MSATTIRAVKFDYEGELRRIKFDSTSFADLEAKIRSVIGLADAPGRKLVIKYKDADEEWITISSDAELSEVLALTHGDVLRLSVERKVKPKPAAVPAVVPPGDPAISQPRAAEGTPSPPPAVVEPSPVPAPQPAMTAEARREEKRRIREQLMAARMEAKQRLRAAAQRLRDEKHARQQQQATATPSVVSAVVPAMRMLVGAVRDKLVARFIKHVSVEDGAVFAPGTKFTKTWRFRNDGSVAWPAGTRLIFVGKGDRLAGPDAVPVVRVDKGDSCVAPGETVDISVELKAPTEPGRYLGYWRLATPEGKKFGQRVWVEINVADGGSSNSSSTSDCSSDSDSAAEISPSEAAAAVKAAKAREKELLKELRRVERRTIRAQRVLKRARKAEKKATAATPKPAELPLASLGQEWEPFVRRLHEASMTIAAKPVTAGTKQ